MKWTFFALLFASAAAPACPGLAVEDAWIREAPPGAMVTAAYARLRNRGEQLLRIEDADSPEFGGAELHRTVVENGISRMLHGQVLELLPGARSALEPGGWHLMLFRPARALKAGEQVPVALRCGTQAGEFLFTVRKGSE
jgi:copper(I)-binding protein